MYAFSEQTDEKVMVRSREIEDLKKQFQLVHSIYFKYFSVCEPGANK